MHVFFPGRHHILTRYQESYLFGLCAAGPERALDLEGRPLGEEFGPIEGIIFAVTSANHTNTRRNPLPFHLRAMAIQDLASGLPVPVQVYGIPDVGVIPDFPEHCLKMVRHLSDGRLDLSPSACAVACSSALAEGYKALGYRILPVELAGPGDQPFKEAPPWELVERIASDGLGWDRDAWLLERIHPASFKILRLYGLGERIAMLFSDSLLGQDGDITETRDYDVYLRQMDDIAQLKFDETRPFIKPGRIGDIGCAAGSWIRLASREPALHESDFYGVEAARQLYALCVQRKENGEFANPNVFFSQRNAVLGPCFPPASMDTVHSSSLTHEIESYSGRESLLAFIRNRYLELAPGGVWINRDVLGPEDGEREILLWLDPTDGRNEGWDRPARDRQELGTMLAALSTRARFRRFAMDFRIQDGRRLEGAIECRSVLVDGQEHFRLSLRDACEYLYKKDYIDNWQSEMHERFCFWDLSRWVEAVRAAGFMVLPASRAFRNEWIFENRLRGRARLFQQKKGEIEELDFPVSHMILVCARERA
jgi:hypothetical protein